MSKAQNTTFLIVTAIIAMTAGLWLASNNSSSTDNTTPPRIQGAIYSSEKKVQSFNLVDHLGNPFTENDFKNRWSLLFVGYTHCPDVCPSTLNLMASVNNELSAQAIQPPSIIFLSIDPERDTVDTIKNYVEYFNPEFTGVTGSLTEIDKLSRNLNAVYKKAPGLNGKITDKDYLMDHSSALMLINPNGNLQSILTAPHTLGNVIDSILKSQVYFDSQQ